MKKWIGSFPLLIALVIMAVVVAPGPAAAQQAGNSSAAAPAGKDKEKNGTELPKAATTDPGYVIGADDVLFVSVWKEPDVSGTVTVRPDGRISVPLLKDVDAAGLTPVQLSMAITEKLRKYIAEPQVTVIVTTINSRRVHIVGEVNRAGTFPMLPDMTVLQALSAAGGFTQFADVKKIYVLRIENGVQKKFPFNYREVLKGNRLEQNIKLKPNDMIVVP
jgi:polysaccharide export outer membrane protein